MKEFHREVLELIIKPTLVLFEHKGFPELNTPEAVDLIYGTALAETGLREIQQGEGGKRGPALSYWQMEPSTHDDIWTNYLKHEARLRKALIDITLIDPGKLDAGWQVIGDAFHPLIWNIRYACAMVRIHYLRQRGKIPTTVEGQAEYWLENYNGGGKGSVEHYIEARKAA